MPKVSVIMPVFNNEAYLTPALESVLKQTYQDFEITIIDDGSRDASPALALRYAGQYPGRVVYLRQENRGPGAARNTGMAKARGEYIAFLDADDTWVETKLEKQAAVLDRDPSVGLVYTDFCFVDTDGEVMERASFRQQRMPRGDIALHFFHRYFMFTSTVMVRKTLTGATGLFREDIFVGEDFDYLLRLSARCFVEILEEKLLVKLSREDSLSSMDATLNARNDLIVLEDFIRANPAFYRNNRPTVSEILSRRYLSLGYWAMRGGEKQVSLRYAWSAMRHKPSFAAARCMAQNAFPVKLLGFVRRVVRGPGAGEPVR